MPPDHLCRHGYQLSRVFQRRSLQIKQNKKIIVHVLSPCTCHLPPVVRFRVRPRATKRPRGPTPLRRRRRRQLRFSTQSTRSRKEESAVGGKTPRATKRSRRLGVCVASEVRLSAWSPERAESMRGRIGRQPRQTQAATPNNDALSLTPRQPAGRARPHAPSPPRLLLFVDETASFHSFGIAAPAAPSPPPPSTITFRSRAGKLTCVTPRCNDTFNLVPPTRYGEWSLCLNAGCFIDVDGSRKTPTYKPGRATWHSTRDIK